MSFRDGDLVYVDNIRNFSYSPNFPTKRRFKRIEEFNREKIYEITSVLWEQNHDGNRLWFVWNSVSFAYVPENALTHIEKGIDIALKTGIITIALLLFAVVDHYHLHLIETYMK